MHVAFVNPQGNFDPEDSYWTAHPDFGGQLVYVKELALAMGNLGHKVDIVTRRIIDPDWPEFASDTDAYSDAPNVRILRIPCGPDEFLPKEELWPYLGHRVRTVAAGAVRARGLVARCRHVALRRRGTLRGTSRGANRHPLQLHGPFPWRAEDGQDGDPAQRHRTGRRPLPLLQPHRGRTPGDEPLERERHEHLPGALQPVHPQRLQGGRRPVGRRPLRRRPAGRRPAHLRQVGPLRGRRGRPANSSRRRWSATSSRGRIGLPCVVASSRLDPKKNHLALVEAFAGSPTLRESANLVILTGSLENPLEDYGAARDEERAVLDSLMEVIDRTGMRGEVSMFALRGQRALAAAYRYLARRRSVFALTALYEPFGLAPLEAMAAGLPAVVTKFGGPSESMREGDEEYGILVDPNRPRGRRGRPARPDEQPGSVGALRRGRLRPRPRPLHLGEDRRRIPRGHLGRKERRRRRARGGRHHPARRRRPEVASDGTPVQERLLSPPTSRTRPRRTASRWRRSTSSTTGSTFWRSGRRWSISSRTRWPIL